MGCLLPVFLVNAGAMPRKKHVHGAFTALADMADFEVLEYRLHSAGFSLSLRAQALGSTLHVLFHLLDDRKQRSGSIFALSWCWRGLRKIRI